MKIDEIFRACVRRNVVTVALREYAAEYDNMRNYYYHYYCIYFNSLIVYLVF